MEWEPTFLAGPTGVGKSAVAHAIALDEGWDILSADAMSIYRGMDIGTAKPSHSDQAEVRYWGIDLVDPDLLPGFRAQGISLFTYGADVSYLAEGAGAAAAAVRKQLDEE